MPDRKRPEQGSDATKQTAPSVQEALELAKAETAALTTLVARLREQAEESTGRQLELEFDHALATEQAKHLRVQVMVLVRERDEARSGLKVTAAELEELKRQRDRLQQQGRELTAIAKRMSGELATLRQQLDQAEQRLALAAPRPAWGETSAISGEHDGVAYQVRFLSAAAEMYRGDPGGDQFALPTIGEDEGQADQAGEWRFALQAGQTCIEYLGEEEIVELYHSTNFAHVSADGRGQENCRGYICCLKGGGGWQTFVALQGTESGSFWVFAPARQPVDPQELAASRKEAHRFAEEVGFIMEPIRRDDSQDQLRQAVARCPVLKKTIASGTGTTASRASAL